MTPQDNGESILLEAQRLTHGDRNANYGHPLDDYSRTAALMSALLHHKLTEPVTAEEAAMCMCAVKLSRHAHRPKRDNMVDLAGYAWVVWACTEERERREAAMCVDEGCPYYGTPHGHTSATNEATVEPQPEGFPGGFEVKPGDTFPADGPEHDPCDHPDAFEQYRESMVMPAVQAAEVTRAALTLDCGCVKRCKGHTTENFRAAPVDIVPAFKATLTGTVMSPTSSPGNYAAERASGPKDPQGRPYATTTADAEFPLAPPVTRPRTFEDFSASIAGLPLVGVETDGPMEFDPAD